MPDMIRQTTRGNIVDTSAKLTAPVIQQVAAGDYIGIVRYVPLPGLSAAQDIDAAELRTILDAGLGVMLVQHVRFPGWDPRNRSGKTDALAAIEQAEVAQYLSGGHIFLDLEGIKGTAQDTKRFAEDWAATIVDAGYCAGCYVGFGVPLNAVQLYNLHDIHSYWSDAGARSVATRGFAMKQMVPEVQIGGIGFDVDAVAPDRLGDMPFWMIAGPAAEAVAAG
jgi:hypothetical protein